MLCLLHRLVNYGHYGRSSETLSEIQNMVMNILDGESDLPVSMLTSKCVV